MLGVSLIVPISCLISSGIDGIDFTNFDVKSEYLLGSLVITFSSSLTEEIEHRAILLGYMSRIDGKTGILCLLGLQSLIFAAMHGAVARGDFEFISWYSMGGLLFGCIYLQCGVLVAAVSHFIINIWIAQISHASKWFAGGGLVMVHGNWRLVFEMLAALFVLNSLHRLGLLSRDDGDFVIKHGEN